MDVEEIKNKLCKGEFSNFSISWNEENSINYQNVAQMLEDDDGYYEQSFVSEEERQKCIDTNSIWTAHWYPETPIGFCKLHASTFEALKKALIAEIEE